MNKVPDRSSSLEEWLAWLETLHPKEIELGLNRITQVALRLGFSELIEGISSNTEPTIVTVAGTNGKGSCVAALEALLLSEGETVGAYTSPHLLRYNERIRVDGLPVNEEEICSAFVEINQARGDISLSYFEFGTLAAFLIFKQKKVDFWLLEVGLGGRLDAVNCLEPDLAVITSISLDHQNWLGDSREKIAIEKAGILRPGLPLVCSDQEPPFTLLDVSEKLMCVSYFIGDQFGIGDEGIYYTDKQGVRNTLDARFKHSHLPQASLVAAMQVFVLLGFSLTPSVVDLLVGLQLAGRFNTVKFEGAEVILDVAHNTAAAEFLAERIDSRWPQQKFTALVAFMADKDISSTVKPLLPLVHNWCCYHLKDNPRAASPQSVVNVLEKLGVASDLIKTIDSVEEGLSQKAKNAEHQKTIVFGSFYTVAAVQEYLNERVSASG